MTRTEKRRRILKAAEDVFMSGYTVLPFEIVCGFLETMTYGSDQYGFSKDERVLALLFFREVI